MTMSRQWVLVCLLLLIVFTSQFEWKQQYVNEAEASQNAFPKQQYASDREESVKEKIILSQEKNIKKLNELVRSLREELQQCRARESEFVNSTATSFAELLTELEHRPIVDD